MSSASTVRGSAPKNLKKTDPWKAFHPTEQKYLKVAPKAEKKAHKVLFGKVEGQDRGDPKRVMDPPVEISDPYFWIRDDKREKKAVLDLLHAENAYTNHRTVCAAQPRVVRC
jgi:protease II